MRDRTVFLIAHRISTVKQADLVIVLERGQVTQMGTHDQLMEEEGHYRNIAQVQLYGDDVERDAEGEELSHMKRIKDEIKVSATAAAARGQESAGSEANLG